MGLAFRVVIPYGFQYKNSKIQDGRHPFPEYVLKDVSFSIAVVEIRIIFYFFNILIINQHKYDNRIATITK